MKSLYRYFAFFRLQWTNTELKYCRGFRCVLKQHQLKWGLIGSLFYMLLSRRKSYIACFETFPEMLKTFVSIWIHRALTFKGERGREIELSIWNEKFLKKRLERLKANCYRRPYECRCNGCGLCLILSWLCLCFEACESSLF